MNEQAALSFYDMQDGEDTILLTDGSIGTFAQRADFVDPAGREHEQMFQIMSMIGAVMPLEKIKREGGNEENWVRIDAQGNPLQ